MRVELTQLVLQESFDTVLSEEVSAKFELRSGECVLPRLCSFVYAKTE